MNNASKTPRFVCRAAVCCALGGLFLLQSVAATAVRAGELSATAKQLVRPVLVRNAHNRLMRLSVEVKRSDVRVTSFTFTLHGSDDPGDVESLQLFYAGENQAFSTKTAFGAVVIPAGSKPDEELTFHADHKLRPGKNVFWLSCKLRATADLSHKVDAVCISIETSEGKVRPRDLTPTVRKRVGIALRKHNDDGVHTYRIPALATTPKGTLLCVYDMRRRKSRDLQEDIDIGLIRSTDGGRSWLRQQVIMDMGEYGGLPQEQNGCSDPGIVVDQTTGDIFCFAVWMWGKPGMHQWSGKGSEPGYEIGKSAQLLMVRSSDDGRTWTKPQNLTRTLKKEAWWLLAPSPTQGLTLRDGTLVMPGEGRDEKGVSFSNLIISRDHGATWTLSNPAYARVNECQAVELGDGSLMLNMRNDNPEPFRAVCVTHDLGKTWQPHATNRNTLIEPNCNGSLYRFDYNQGGKEKHILLFANPHTRKGRHHHTLQISFDDGSTWSEKHKLLLDEGRGRGYPSISRIDKTHVGIVYEGSGSDLVFEKFSIDELLKR